MKYPEEHSLAAQIWALRQYGGVGPRTFRTLLARFGGPSGIHSADITEFEEIKDLGDDRRERIRFALTDPGWQFDDALMMWVVR